MKTQLTDDMIRCYQDEGFVHVPGFLEPDEIVELKQAVLAAIDHMAREFGNRRVAGDGTDLSIEADSYYASVFTQRLNLWKINDTVKRYMLNPALGELLCRLAGVQAMRVWHDQALIKEPFGNPTAWHLDNPYWSFHSRQSLSIWIALEDATLANGCMHFIPNTVELATYDNVGIGENMAGLFEVYPENV